MSVTNIESFHIIGITVKTSNENGQSGTDIPKLWEKFMGQQTMTQIPNKISSDIYCIYTNYEGDHTKPYTTLLGCKVNSLEEIPSGMEGMTFPAANYQKFQTKGDLTTGIVYQEWMNIWNNIDQKSRTFSADFEIYGERAQNPMDAEVDIFVGVS